jgi:hypothetical protein
MPDYSKSKVYCIYSPSHLEDGEYIGSTICSLSKRMNQHRIDYNLSIKDGRRFHTKSHLILQYEDARIELIEECPCENREQLLKKEGEYIRSSSNCVNKQILGRTKDEWYIDNRESIIDRVKTNYYNNRETKLDNVRVYASKNKEKISEYQKEYFQKNKDTIREYKKEYRIRNREKINTNMREWRIKQKEIQKSPSTPNVISDLGTPTPALE